ncbi:tetratricopeptide repeat protein [Gimibacter soli]|uniref:Tetratricopeptide repeat protein n=1 Tax=Gimibacter soli TaxID=3024400 RepID=A0AAF0BL76_9PROT|nr:tetratricopeptide repeat protein [Gimibacter soli]WCL52846.1 tetratricopeptide repeat protein [Gimibacter soli]
MKKDTILSIRITLKPLFLGASLLLAACASNGQSSGKQPEGGLSKALKGDPQAMYEVGEGMERSGNLGNALDLYSRALDADPSNWRAGLAIGRVLFRSGDVVAARNYIASLGVRFPDEPQVAETLADMSGRMGDFAGAARAIEPWLRQVPPRPSLALIAGKLLEIKGDAESARQMFAIAQEEPSLNGEAMAALTWSFSQSGNMDTARVMLMAMSQQPATLPLAQTMSRLIRARQGEQVKIEGVVSPEQLELIGLLPTLSPTEAAAAVYFGYLPPEPESAPEP